jgi:hypothetical protein
MKNLKRLMCEFAILDMEPEPLEAESGMEFDQSAAPVASAVPAEAPAEEVEYELDADGNPILDAEGNPVPKVKPEAGSSCTCDHNTLPAASEPPVGGITAELPLPPAYPVENEDEFDFNI